MHEGVGGRRMNVALNGEVYEDEEVRYFKYLGFNVTLDME